MTDEKEQLNHKDRPDQAKPDSIEQKARFGQPGEIIDLDQSAPRGRRPLFRS